MHGADVENVKSVLLFLWHQSISKERRTQAACDMSSFMACKVCRCPKLHWIFTNLSVFHVLQYMHTKCIGMYLEALPKPLPQINLVGRYTFVTAKR